MRREGRRAGDLARTRGTPEKKCVCVCTRVIQCKLGAAEILWGVRTLRMGRTKAVEGFLARQHRFGVLRRAGTGQGWGRPGEVQGCGLWCGPEEQRAKKEIGSCGGPCRAGRAAALGWGESEGYRRRQAVAQR